MKIALSSDEVYSVHQTLHRELERRGHEVVPFGSIANGSDVSWVEAAESAAQAVASGQCDEGVVACWSGTGICMASNKVFGIRAALCTDPETARAARTWNDANVLCLSNRLLSEDLAKEILAAWFEPWDSKPGAEGVERLKALDGKLRS